jgi:hypothetical protein
MHAAMFDAAAAVTKTHAPYKWAPSAADQLSAAAGGPSLELTLATAAHRVLTQIYPDDATALTDAYHSWLPATLTNASDQQAILYGQSAGDYLVSLRSSDDGTSAPGAAPAAGPGVWVPTPTALAPYSLPGWGSLTPFTMSSGSQFRSAGPPALASAQYATDYNEVKTLGPSAASSRTADQTEIAQFWADGSGTSTPAGHWNLIAQSVATDRGLSTIETARLFALMNLAMADAAIAAWDMKWHYYMWRPVTGIRDPGTDGNASTTDDSTWTPLLTTPSFPTYVSGHSTFSGAASRVLALSLGSDDISFSTTSEHTSLSGVTRSFGSFTEAAEEAGRSRIYGGIHFEFDNQDGLTAGRSIADHVYSNFLRPY